jgi:hypothetical protein
VEETANTLNYFVAGYSIIFTIMLGYVVSLIIRWKNLKQEDQLLADLKDKDA